MYHRTELRVILIGEMGVGKKSIVQRFKKLNTTKTSIDKYFIQKEIKNYKNNIIL